MSKSPFIYGNTVSSKSFTDREAEVAKLRQNLTSGINTMVISPRRWGKSSLVEKVIADINRDEQAFKTVVIDLFSVGSEEEFLETYAREVIRCTSSKLQDWLQTGKDFFKNLIPQFRIGIDPTTDFSLSFDWKELKKHSDEVLNLPEKIARSKDLKIIICLDEFQNLSSFPDYQNFEKKMRAVWQRQKLVTYCMYGSKKHMMTDIFNNPSKPFYRFGDIIMLQKIERSKWVNFICESFTGSGKQINESLALLIPKMMKDHSWYVQQLAHYTWNLSDLTVSVDDINSALSELINANMPLYQKDIESISNTQLNLLKAILQGEKQFTSTAVMNRYMLGTPRNVSKNKQILINNDLVYLNPNGAFEFVDPAFELWFRNQFFNQSYKIN